MKGIIAEISGKYAVVLTQTGSFKKVKATSDMIVGKEIDLNRPAGNNRMARTAMKVTSLAAAGLLVFGVGLGAYCYTLPYSYVHVDINPSIELTVNVYDRIIRAEALNVDGEELLGNNDLKNIKVDAGVTRLLNAAVQQGYLSNAAAQPASVLGQSADLHDQPADDPVGAKDTPTRANPDEDSNGDKPETTPDEYVESEPKALEIANAVLVTISSNNTRKSGALKKELADAVLVELEKDQVKSDILVAQTSIAQRNDARKYGVTPGKMVLIEDAMEGKPASDLDKLKKTAIKDLLKMATDKNKLEKKLIEEKQKEAEKNNKDKSEREEIAKQGGKKAEEEAEAQEKKAEAQERKAEAQEKKTEADRKKAEEKRLEEKRSEEKKAEDEKDRSKNDQSLYKGAWDKWKTDNGSDNKNQAQYQGNTGDQENKGNKSESMDQSITNGKIDTEAQWNKWNTDRKTRQDLKDEREQLKKELLEQMRDNLMKNNDKRNGQDNQRGSNKGSK